jgi:hypothetical protein
MQLTVRSGVHHMCGRTGVQQGINATELLSTAHTAVCNTQHMHPPGGEAAVWIGGMLTGPRNWSYSMLMPEPPRNRMPPSCCIACKPGMLPARWRACRAGLLRLYGAAAAAACLPISSECALRAAIGPSSWEPPRCRCCCIMNDDRNSAAQQEKG